jgi:hypothetical protein
MMGHPSSVFFLRIVAGAARRPAFFPQLFPIPEAGRDLDRQWESELMSEHANLTAVMGFVGQHVTQHFDTDRPGLSPAVAAKVFDATATAERFREHLAAAGGALGQCPAGLLRSAVGAVQLLRNFEVCGGQPDPLGANVVHVGEDRGDGPGLAGRFGAPGARIEMFDKKLVHALIGGKDVDGGSAELRMNVVLTRGHGTLLL